MSGDLRAGAGDGGRAPPRDRPLLVFDGACRFCTAIVRWLEERFVRPVDTVPWQRADLEGLGIGRRQAARFVWWIDGDGSRHKGHRAAARALRACAPPWPRVGRLLGSRWLWFLTAPGYRFVSAIRGILPGRAPACRPPGCGDSDRRRGRGGS